MLLPLPVQPHEGDPILGGAEFHDYHHYAGGKTHSNFGSLFTYCDYIYGTNKVGLQFLVQMRAEYITLYHLSSLFIFLFFSGLHAPQGKPGQGSFKL